jgi:hypothetical protein
MPAESRGKEATAISVGTPAAGAAVGVSPFGIPEGAPTGWLLAQSGAFAHEAVHLGKVPVSSLLLIPRGRHSGFPALRTMQRTRDSIELSTPLSSCLIEARSRD